MSRTKPRDVGLAMKRQRSGAQKERKAKKSKGFDTRKVATHAVRNAGTGFKPELKAFDVWDSNVSIPPGTGSASHVALLNAMQLGSDRFNRIGRKVQIKKIHVRISLHPVTPVPTSVPEDIVVMLVWDTDGNTLPGLAQLLADTSLAGVIGIDVNSHQNLDESTRWKILKRKVIPLRVCGTATGALPCNGAAFQALSNDLHWDWNIDCDLLTQYSSLSNGNVADISNGSLILCWWTNLAVGLPPSALSYRTRIRYFD